MIGEGLAGSGARAKEGAISVAWFTARCEQATAVRSLRSYAVLAGDAAASVGALFLALVFRLTGDVSAEYTQLAIVATPVLVLVRLTTSIGAGVHYWSFRMSGLAEAARLASAVLAGSIVFAALMHGLTPLTLPRGVYVLEFFFSATLMGAFRFAPRVVDEWYSERHRRASAGARAIVVGASATGDLLARDLLHSDRSMYFLVGFVDDDAAKLGMRVCGKPVLGTIAALPRLVAEHRVSTVLLAAPDLSAAGVRGILKLCAASNVSFKTIPASYASLDDRISAAMLHDLAPEDLLPRAEVAFDGAEIRKHVMGRRVLVTGAGGSIGGEICAQLAHYGVAELVMLDMNENELYLRTRSLQQQYPSLSVHPEVADIRELARLNRVAARYLPELVFHAAAHKHVPLMEEAPEEAVKNNVFGTLNVALMAHGCEAERLVLISTDKAVKPTSVMGATKRIAELVVRDLAQRSQTNMTAVRFGNVLGSAGSVVPLFKQQIEAGGPVTLTHPDCTRYFMTVSESVGLVLLAGLGGYGDLCVLDMGEPIRIADLAHNLITLAGRVPNKEIPIVYTGLRPGEKLHEELLTEDEERTVLVRDRIHVATSPPPPAALPKHLHELQERAEEGDREGLLKMIQLLVPTYRRTPAQPAAPYRTPDGTRSLVPPENEDRAATQVPNAKGASRTAKRSGSAAPPISLPLA